MKRQGICDTWARETKFAELEQQNQLFVVSTQISACCEVFNEVHIKHSTVDSLKSRKITFNSSNEICQIGIDESPIVSASFV